MLGLHFRLITGSAEVSDRPMSSFARLGLIERELAGDDYPQIRDALANWWAAWVVMTALITGWHWFPGCSSITSATRAC